MVCHEAFIDDPQAAQDLLESGRLAHIVPRRQDTDRIPAGAVLPTGREAFGFKDGIGQPAVEGSGIPGTNPKDPPLKAGEFLLGYEDETGALSPMPRPEVLGRNGTYVTFRKLHQRVAAFRQYLRANSTSPDDEALLAAKMLGRWPSGAPLALCPTQDDPECGADPRRNNDFLYHDDPKGLKTPPARTSGG